MSLRLISFVLLILASTFTQAKILEVKVLGSQIESFELKDVCISQGIKDPLLVSVKDAHRIDCMGKLIAASDFCQQKYPTTKDQTKALLTRSYVGTVIKQVYCERGDSVLIRLACDDAHASYCVEPKAGCLRLKPVFAGALPISEAVKIGKILRCYYSFDENDQILESQGEK